MGYMLGAAVIVAAVVIAGLYYLGRYPAINDVTTTPGDPPAFRAIARLPVHRGRDVAFDPALAGIIRERYADLRPALVSTGERARAFVRVRAAARRMPRWRIVGEDEQAGVLEAVATARKTVSRAEFLAASKKRHPLKTRF